MSQFAAASKITLKQIVDQAKVDVAERVANKQTPVASYFIEDGGAKYVITVTPADQITNIANGRRSTQATGSS